MIVLTKSGISPPELTQLRQRLEAFGLTTHVARRRRRVLVGCVGDQPDVATQPILDLPGVESVTPSTKPYRLATRAFGFGDASIVRASEDCTFGGERLAIIAGPCSVEGDAMLRDTARAVRRAGATALRGGAFKPRTSPYAFNGLGIAALEMLAAAREESGLPVVSEVMDTRHVELVARYADVLQVGARNMQNYSLLAEVGTTRKPVLLKRGLSATIAELLLAAEHIMAQGNYDVILCERGIRTFETATRNTLDVAAIPVLKRETHLPVIVDPSHAGGRASLVTPLALAAIAAGADGLFIEVHPDPTTARSDGDQSLTFDDFERTMRQVAAVAHAVGRTVTQPVAHTMQREERVRWCV
jgi:3-deoxy-7-phosphoheptulonate synthase